MKRKVSFLLPLFTTIVMMVMSPQRMWADKVSANQPEPVDGVYEIYNANQLAWFRDFVNTSSDNLTANAKLMADIDLSSICHPASTGVAEASWNPIARYDKYQYSGYQGVFDGNHKKITNLYIKNAGYTQCIGFFSILGKNSVVKDLTISGTVIETQSHYVNGILTGATYDCKLIENVRTSGSVTTNGAQAAGIVGESFGKDVVTEIKGCLNEADIKGRYEVAGIVGKTYSTNIRILNCGNVGNITSTAYSTYSGNGGIAGTLQCLHIENCYSSGKVTAENDPNNMTGVLFGYLGSLAPSNEATGLYYVPIEGMNYFGKASSSYNKKYPSTEVTAADVTNGNLAYLLQGNNEKVIWGQNLDTSPVDAFPVPGAPKVYPAHKNCGGKYVTFKNTEVIITEDAGHTLADVAEVLAENNEDGTIAYKHCTVCDNNYDAEGNLLSAADLIAHSFDENGICTNNHTTPAYQPATAVYKQDGTIDYYAISKVGQMAWFRDFVNGSAKNASANAKLTADIDLSLVCSETSGVSWTPIAESGSMAADGYLGTFDGGGNKVSGLYINGAKDYLGLFGILGENSAVANLKIDGKIISTKGYAGLLAGQATKSTSFEDIQTSGSITTDGTNVGGIVGYYYLYSGTGTIKRCFNSADIKGRYNLGGLFGRVSGSVYVVMSDCGNVGNIVFTHNNTSSSAVGGLVGVISAKYVSNCYSVGTITTTLTTTPTMPVGQLLGYVQTISTGASTGLYYYATTKDVKAVGKGVAPSVQTVTASELANGKLAFDLQGTRQDLVWGQAIGTDEYPVPGGSRVYAGKLYCDGSVMDYSEYVNDLNKATRHHDYSLVTSEPIRGFYHPVCSICGTVSPSTLIEQDGQYIQLRKDGAGNYTSTLAISFSDEYEFTSPVSFTSVSPTKPSYTREMSYEWGTIVLPFAIDYDADNTEYNLYTLSGATNATFTFTEYESGLIAPGTPMVIKAIGDKNADGKYVVTITGANNTVTPKITKITPIEGWTMNGTFTDLTNQTGMYYIGANQFWKANGTTFSRYRAWFETTNEGFAKVISISDAGDDATSIDEVEGVVYMDNSKCYNLQGQKLDAPRKGQINIINGKKVFVK